MLSTSHTGLEYSSESAGRLSCCQYMDAKNTKLTISKSIMLNIHLTNWPYLPLLFIQGVMVLVNGYD